jgi:hypothetical protein
VNARRLFFDRPASAGRTLPAARRFWAAPALASVRALARRPHAGIALLVGAWLALVLLANPTGSFPLNDDWSFSKAVENLVDHGRLAFTGWTSMTLVAQVLWGAAFCLPFGFSFLALRLSTVVLGAIGIVAAYALLRELGTARRIGLLGAAVIGLNPRDPHVIALGPISPYAEIRRCPFQRWLPFRRDAIVVLGRPH